MRPQRARTAREAFRKACPVCSKMYWKIHDRASRVGRTSWRSLLWDETVRELDELVRYAGFLEFVFAWGNTLAKRMVETSDTHRKNWYESPGPVCNIDIGHARVCRSWCGNAL
jgi:hypothetical protein